MDTESWKKETIRKIVQAYDDRIVRLYSTIRFLILRQRFLDEIGQYLPRSGVVLDVGCGFGLFSLYFASVFPELQIRGIDLNPRRIELARKAAAKLGLTNVEYEVADAEQFTSSQPLDGAYMLDLVHHVSPDAVGPLLADIAGNLGPGRRLIVKDIEPAPFYKLAFTWLLDKAMDYRAAVRYWAPEEMRVVLKSLGFEVFKHSMLDYLPYPHVIYVAAKAQSQETVCPRCAAESLLHSPERSAA